MPVPVVLTIHATEPLSTAPFASELERVTDGAGTGAGAGATTAVGSEVAADDGHFVGVTVTRSLAPTSVVATAYVCAVAPARLTHELPFTSHRSHWYVKEVWPPPHVETPAVSVAPALAVPVSVGFHAGGPLAPAGVVSGAGRATTREIRCRRGPAPPWAVRPHGLPCLRFES